MARSTNKKRVEKKAVLIALEDEKSSRYYFQSLVKDKGLSGQVIFATHRGSKPKEVLDTLNKHKREDKNKSKITPYEKKWIVIDRDSHDSFFETIKIAKENNICVAFSNESYELWLLLHFNLLSVHTHRDNLTSKLNKIFQEEYGLEYSKSSHEIYALILSRQPQAIKNAKTLVENSLEEYREIDPRKNPLTTIYQLVECLNYLYLKDKNCECYPVVNASQNG